MGNIIDINEIRNIKEMQKNTEAAILEKEINRRVKIELSEYEAYVLLDSYLEAIAVNIDNINLADEEQGTYIEEEIEGNKHEIKRYIKLFKRLENQYNKIKCGDNLVIKYDLKDLYSAICSLEMSADSILSDMIFGHNSYGELDEFEKIQLHLYKIFRDIEWNRLKITNPEYIENMTKLKSGIPNSFAENINLTRDNIEALCEHKYNKEYKENIVLIEDPAASFENSSNTYYHIQCCPKEFKPILKKLSLNGYAKYFNNSDIERQQKIDDEITVFSKGWRLCVKEGDDIHNIKRKYNKFSFCIISYDDYIIQESSIYERRWDILDRKDELFYDLYDLKIISDIG